MDTQQTKPGRPAKDGAVGLKRVSALLTPEQIAKAKELGHGNMTLGLRKALDSYQGDKQ